ncbi:hypothetical protein GQ44DRAFT_57631 [Phaeosphaeriaceae sp. PMI808]|nr:hypothetical protein GQ44DRAFT_57631 [Phaeosphaeriaceae sp. PMI808]
MHQFDREVEDAVLHRYNLIYPQLIRGLAKHLNSEVRNYAKTHHILLLRPALLGPNEADARVWIVVNCEQCAVSKAKQFFDQAWVRSLYEASGECPVGFKVFIDGPF